MPACQKFSERGSSTIRSSGTPLLLPELDRLGVGAEAELLVAAEDRDPDLVRVEAEAVERELPGEVDRLLLEVVAEAKLPSISKKVRWRAVLADLLDVGGAEAALAGGEPRRPAASRGRGSRA